MQVAYFNEFDENFLKFTCIINKYLSKINTFLIEDNKYFLESYPKYLIEKLILRLKLFLLNSMYTSQKKLKKSLKGGGINKNSIQFNIFDGNIGVGKSTLLENIYSNIKTSNDLCSIILKEPLNLWQNIFVYVNKKNNKMFNMYNGKNILECFYISLENDIFFFQFLFQLIVLCTKILNLENVIINLLDSKQYKKIIFYAERFLYYEFVLFFVYYIFIIKILDTFFYFLQVAYFQT